MGAKCQEGQLLWPDVSRSKRKTQICGNCGGSEKKDKIIWHKAFRRVSRARLKRGDDPILHPEEVKMGNVWAMQKDGKNWFHPERLGSYGKKLMRK